MPPIGRSLKPSPAGVLAILGGILIAALAAWNLGSTLWMMFRFMAPGPIGDQWDSAYFPDGLPGSLLKFHSEHRPALGRLTGALDWSLDAGRNLIDAGFTALCFPLFGLTIAALVRMTGASMWRSVAAGVLAVAILASGEQSENLLWGFQTTFVGSFPFSLLALVAAVGVVTPGRSRVMAALAFAGCVAASLVAVFSIASGLLVLPAVIFVLTVGRAPRPLHFAYLLLAAGVVLFYFHDYVGGPSSSHLAALKHPRALMTYPFAYLGSGVGSPDVDASVAAGAAGVLALAVLVVDFGVRFLKRRALSAADLAYLALLVFGAYLCAVAGAAAAGRVDLGLGQALSSRYGAASLSFWADLVALGLARGAMGGGGFAAASGLAGLALGVLLAVLTAVQQPHYFPTARALYAARINGAIAYRLGVRTDPVVLNIYPVPAVVLAGGLDERFQRLVTQRKGLFAEDWPWRLGAPLASWAPLTGPCDGVVDVRLIGATQPRTASQMAGWVWDRAARRVPDMVVFTDDAGRITGFGKTGGDRPDVAQAMSSKTATDSGWLGTALADNASAVHLYGLYLGSRPHACSVVVSHMTPTGIVNTIPTVAGLHKDLIVDDGPRPLGSPLASWARTTGACDGFVDSRKIVATEPRPVSQMAGWAWDRTANRVPDRVVFTDDAGRITGFGKTGGDRPDVAQAMSSRTATDSGWQGTALADEASAVHLYGLYLGAQPHVCSVVVSRVTPGGIVNTVPPPTK